MGTDSETPFPPRGSFFLFPGSFLERPRYQGHSRKTTPPACRLSLGCSGIREIKDSDTSRPCPACSLPNRDCYLLPVFFLFPARTYSTSVGPNAHKRERQRGIATLSVRSSRPTPFLLPIGHSYKPASLEDRSFVPTDAGWTAVKPQFQAIESRRVTFRRPVFENVAYRLASWGRHGMEQGHGVIARQPFARCRRLMGTRGTRRLGRI